MAALASISFTTLSSGTLSAAFFFGSQAFAEEAADNPGATIDIGDTNLDAQAAIDEEEGRGEAKEPGSAPINQAGFNGIYGSSDDADRAVATEVIAESSIDTENVGTAGQANYTSTSADLPSDNLGFTANPYAAGSGSSNGSVVDSPVTSFTQAPQIAPTGGYSAAGTGSGSSSNKTSPVSVFGNTGSGAFGGGSFGSGISLGSVTKAAPTPVILGAAVGATGDTTKYATWNFEGNLDATTDGVTSQLSPTWNGGSASYVDTGMYIGWESNGYVIGTNLGKAVDFSDGQWVKVSAGNTFSSGDLALDKNKAFTVSVWVQMDNVSGENPSILGTGSGNTAGFGLMLKDTKLDYLAKGKDHHQFAGDQTGYSTGRWYNLTITNTGDGKAYGYVNGVSVGELSTNFNFATANDLYIGSLSENNAQDNFDGRIASVEITSTCLTADEVKARYGMTALANVGTYTWNGASGNSWDAAVWTLGETPDQKFQAGSNAVFAADHAGTVNVNATTGAHNASVAGSYTFNLADGITFSTYALTVNDGSSLTLTGGSAEVALNSLSGSGSLTFNSTGTAQLLGSSANYSGNVAIKDGTVAVKAQDALGTGTVTVEGGTLETHVALGKAITLSGGTLAGAGSNATYSGAITVSAASTIMTASSQTVTVSGLVSGSGSIEKVGAGSLTLSAANTFTGSLTISEGTVKVGNYNALGAYDASRLIEVAAGATLDVNGNEGGGSTGKGDGYTVTLSGGTLTNTGTPMENNKRQYVTHLNLTADSKVVAAQHFGLIGSNYAATSMDLGGHTLTIEGPNTYYVNNATITGGGQLKVASGTLNFNTGTNDSQVGSFASNFELAGGTITGRTLTLARDIYINTTATAGSTMSLPVKRAGHGITFKGDGALTVSGNMTGLGSLAKEGAGALTVTGSLDVNGTIQLQGGSLALGGTVTVNARSINAFEVFDATAQTYSYAAKNSGFLTSSGQYYLVKGAENTTATLTGTVTGATVVAEPTKEKGAGDIIITFENPSATTYFVNEDMATGEDVAITSTAKDIAIKAGTTLTASASSAAFSTAKLQGEGTYALASGSKALNGNLSLGDDWSGIVRLTGVGLNGENLASTLTKNGSWVEMYGVTGGHIDGWNNGTQTANFILTDKDANTVAWKYSNGASDRETIVTFTGTFTGDGTFSKDDSKFRQGFKFTGDISGWKGNFWAKTTQANAITRIEFAEGANEVNLANIVNKGSNDLNVMLSNTGTVSVASNINKESTGAVNITVGSSAQATFAGTINATTLAVAAGGSATLNANTTVGGLTGAGNIVSTNTITLNSTGDYTFDGALTTLTLLRKNENTATGTQTFNGLVTVTGDTRTEVYKGGFNFNAGYKYTGGNKDYAIVTASGTTVHFGGDSDMGGKLVGNGGSSTIVVDEGATLTARGFWGTTTSSSGNGAVTIASGAEVTTTSNFNTSNLVNSGSLTVGGQLWVTTLSGSGDLTITNDLKYDGGADGSYSGSISAKNITKQGAGKLTLSGENTFTNITQLSAGTLEVAQVGSLGGQGVTTSANTSLIFNTADDGIYGGSITGIGSVTKSGEGNLVLTGANSYTGTTTINAGTLVANSIYALGSGAVTLTGGTLDITSTVGLGTGSFTMDGGTLKLNQESGLTSTNGSLAFTSGTLDLTGLQIEAGNDYTLASSTGGAVTLGGGVNFTIDPALQSQYELKVQDNTLVLSYIQPEPTETLLWLDPEGTWGRKGAWYREDKETRISFEDGANVSIEAPYEEVTINMATDAAANNMTVKKGEGITAATTVTVQDTVNENRLEVRNLDIQEGTTLVAKSQIEVTGTAVLGSQAQLDLQSAKDATIAANITSADDTAVITKSAASTLTLTGDNSGYKGSLNVTGGKLVAQGEKALGAGTVSMAARTTLSLEHSGVDATPMEGGSLSLAEGATISFLGNTSLDLSGSLTLGSGVNWDLSRYAFGDTVGTGLTATLVSVTDPMDATSIANLQSAAINTPGNIANATLSYSGTADSPGAVILTFDMTERHLYWKGGAGEWTINSSVKDWHPSEFDTSYTSFATNDGVTFDSRVSLSSVTLTEDITAGTVTVENGTRVTLQDGTGNATLAATQIDVFGTLGTNVAVAEGTTVNIAETGMWIVSGDQNHTFKGQIISIVDADTGASGGTLSKTGDSSLVLSGNNSGFTGEIQLNSGSITAANANALGTDTTIVMGDGTELKGSGTIAAVNMGGKTIEVANAGTSATVSANLDVAEGTILTFAGDGTLDVTGTMSGSGTITQSGYGVTNIGKLNGFNGTLNIDHGTLVMQSAYVGRAIVNVNMGSTLQFASNVNGEGQAATPLTLTRLTMDAGACFDVSNITLGTVNINGTNVPNAAVLAIVSSGTINDFPHSMETESGARGEADIRMIEGVALSGTEHFFGEGAPLGDNSYLRLRYAYQSGNLVVYLQASYPGGVYWNAESYEAEWENTDKPKIKSWNVANGGTLESNTYYRSGRYGDSLHAPDAYFMKKYFDENNNPVGAIVNMNPTSIQYVGDVIFGEQTDYTINGYYLSLSVTPDGGYSNKEMSYNSAMVVRSGADIKINAAVNAGDGTLVETERDARFIINADIGDKLAGGGAAVSIFNGHNAGYTEINADGINIGSYINDGTMHVKHLDTILFPPGMPDDPFASDVKYITNTKTGVMSFSTDVLAPFMASDTGYDPNILNEGKLYFLSQDDLGINMYEDVPVRGRGEVYTGGTHGVIFDISPYLQVYAPASVQASKLELDAAFTTFNYGVNITDTTTVKAGKDAYFYGGTGVGGPGSLGEVTLETGATMTFGPFAGVAYGQPTGEYTAKTYDMGLVNAGADSVLTVQNGATVTMDGFNAASGVPAGGIVVGTTREGAEEASLGDASLVIGREDNLDAEANVDVFTVLNGTATINVRADINQIMQDGGVLTLNANSVLNGVPVSAEPDAALTGGTVTGGTLALAAGTTLDQNVVIDVRNATGAETAGSYTVSGGAGSRIDATSLDLEVDYTYSNFIAVVRDGGEGEATHDASGFMSAGDEFVKLFDLEYTPGEDDKQIPVQTLTSNNEAVYHASASGMMTLIGNDNWSTLQSELTEGSYNLQEYIGYGYLHTDTKVLKTYYVRDLYTEMRSETEVRLSDIMEGSKPEDPETQERTPQLENVVFDITDYNDDASLLYNGTLTVDENVAVDLFSVSGDAKAAINIAGGTTVTADADSPGVQGNLDLQGSGVYEIQNRNDLGANIGLRNNGSSESTDPEWNGTVRVTGTSTDLTLEDKYVGTGADASTIEFRNWNGALDGGNHTVNGQVVLSSETPTAMKLTGEDAIAYTFTNTVSGSGNIDHAEGGNVAMTFSGDTSGWSGTYEQLSATSDSLAFTGGTEVNANVTSGNGSMNLTYGGSVTTVASGVNVYSGGDTPTTMNVAYTGGGAEGSVKNMEVTGGITSDAQSSLTLTVGDGESRTAATFSGTFAGTENATMAVQSGSTATIGTATIDTNAELLRVLGDEGSNVVVNSGSTLSLASTDPETGYSEFHDLSNAGTIEMKASGGEIHLVDDTAEGNTYNLGNLVLTDPVGTATIETSGVEGKTTNVNITGLTGPKSAAQVLELTNGNGTGTVNYNLGNTDDTKDLNGTIAYGGSGGVTNLVLQENGNSAASAVLETRFTSADAGATANIVVDAEAARVLGLSSDGNSDGKAMKVSGTGAHTAQGAANNSLEITGDGEYYYAGKLGANLDVAYTGEGMQVINGGVDGFNGKVTVDNGSTAAGVLEILNAGSVTITDLTIGTNDTLDLKKNDSNVGTAVVSGTMKAGGAGGTPSKLDGSLTLNDTAIYDVSASAGSGGLNLTGALTIYEGAMLSTSDMATVWNMKVDDMYDLAFGVTDMTSFGSVDWEQGVDASTIFGNGMKEGEFVLRYSGDATGGKGGNVGAVYLFRVAVPEPTTSTLSLLALAALAARRRRK